MKKVLKDILGVVLYIGIIIVMTFFFVHFIAQRTDVSGDSMNYTLTDGDSLIVDKLSYRFSSPKRFDIVIFPYRYDPDECFIKRIIGLPGETVQIDDDGNIFINGEKLEEHYGAEIINDPGRASEPVVLSDDEYFVMGDNRNHSMDSREPSVGNIKRSELIGKAWFRLFPFSAFGPIKK